MGVVGERQGATVGVGYADEVAGGIAEGCDVVVAVGDAGEPKHLLAVGKMRAMHELIAVLGLVFSGEGKGYARVGHQGLKVTCESIDTCHSPPKTW